jgi:hypothetical protein
MVPIIVLVFAHAIIFTPFSNRHATLDSFSYPLRPELQILSCGFQFKTSPLITALSLSEERLSYTTVFVPPLTGF